MAPVTVLKIFAVVIGVINGDTIVVSIDGQERQIVLAGIDAPEQGQPYFEKARDSLADKIKGKKVFIQVFGKTKDGQDTAAVWLDKRSVNAEMVAEGHAWYDPRHPEYKTINKAQKKARQDMLGLWAGKQPIPPWEFVKNSGSKSKEDPFSSLRSSKTPKVISVIPANGDKNVDPNLKAIKVVFDRPMEDKSWSLVGGGPNFPETVGKCYYDSKRTTWTCPIKLKPGWKYEFRLNSNRFVNFRSEKGVSLEPVVISFNTAKGTRNLKSSSSVPMLGELRELVLDDGNPTGKKSFPRGHALMYESPGGDCYLTRVRIHGARYGMPKPPKEDFHVTLCDKNFMPIKDFKFPYSKFKRSDPEWVSLEIPPTKVPEKFVICLNFNAERTKGVYVSHDAEGDSLVALPDKPSGVFSGGHWLIRPTLKSSGAVPIAMGNGKKQETPVFKHAEVPKLGKGQELAIDDGNPADKKSFPRGIASKFESPQGDWWLTSVRIHGARYGMPQAPREDFHVTLCGPSFKPIRDFTFPYSDFKRSSKSRWVSFRIPPTKVPKEFVICLNFNAERTKGVYVSHDAEGTGLVGLPGKPSGSFSGGDWMIRPMLKPAK